MYAGKVFDNGIIPWGSEIDIGSVTVRISRPSAGGRVSLGRIALMGSLAVAAGYLFLAGDSDELPRPTAPPPELFDAMAGTCPEAQRAQARALEALAGADARESRYAYDRVEGIAAVAQLRVAELCASRAGNARLTEQARALRTSLERRIAGDFRALRISLERAIDRGDLVTIATSARPLRRLLAHRPGPYVYWLNEIERKAVEQLARKAKEEEDKLF
jgi:hypothetical protein